MSKILIKGELDVEDIPYLNVDLLIDDATIFNGVHVFPGQALFMELIPGVVLRFTHRDDN